MFKNIPALFSLLACLGAATAQSQSIVATPTWYYTGCTGQIHVDLSISGGIGPYDVYWSCALGNNSGSSQGASVDFNIGGEYLVLIQDFGNLTSAYADYTTLSIIVGLDAVVTHSSCDGDGGIDLTPPPRLTATAAVFLEWTQWIQRTNRRFDWPSSGQVLGPSSRVKWLQSNCGVQCARHTCRDSDYGYA
jgi:hypothetical protein